jgi:hypothetical protein
VNKDWTDFEIGAEVDVTDIMRRIRESIEAKQKAGIYSEEGLAELADAKLMQFAEEAEIDSALLEKLLSPDHGWNINPSYIISTHRSGLQSKLIVFAKKLARPFIRLYTDQLVGRQAQINLYFAHLIHNLVRELTRSQVRQTNLEHRLDRLEREKDFLERRYKTLEKLAELKKDSDEASSSMDA